MRHPLRSLRPGSALLVPALLAGEAVAHAGCLDNAGDIIFGGLTGGASVAACEPKELVESIKNFIQTVSDLATNVASNTKKSADAAIGAVNSGANEIADTLAARAKRPRRTGQRGGTFGWGLVQATGGSGDG